MTGANGEANGIDGVEDNGMAVKEEEEEDNGMAVTTDVKEEVKEEEEEDGMVDGQEEGGGLTVGEGIGQVHNGSISNSGGTTTG